MDIYIIYILYKYKVKNSPCGNRSPRTPLQLNRATTSLICETSCPLTCPHNFILVPPPSTTFSLYSHALFNKNQALPRTRPMPTIFVSILLVYYYLEGSAWSMCIMKPTLCFQNWLHENTKDSKHCHLSGNLIGRPIFTFSVSCTLIRLIKAYKLNWKTDLDYHARYDKTGIKIEYHISLNW